MNWKSRLLYSQNWNIGFCEQSPENLIASKKLNTVHWMKHSYKDRWFADPFILNVTEDEIVVFVEECPIEKPKGILCELHIERKSYKLRERYVLLELDTHLSYPAIIEYEGKIYVYPENGASGKLNIYEYDGNSHRLINPKCILNEAVADSTILEHNGKYYLIATKQPDTQEAAFLYESESLFGPYLQKCASPIQSSKSCSRPAGNWFSALGQLYRPSQDCSIRYGYGINMMSVDRLYPFDENITFEIEPFCSRYGLGCHTINFHKSGICVVDSVGYLHQRWASVYKLIKAVKKKIV